MNDGIVDAIVRVHRALGRVVGTLYEGVVNDGPDITENVEWQSC